MKILIINKYQNKVNRGAETYVFELSNRLANNHEVDVLNNINLFKRYDLIIPTNGRMQVFLVRLLTWLTNSKMIVSGQSGIGLDDRLNLYSFPDYFIPLTNFAKKWADRINPFVNKVVIPNGVDLKKFNSKKTNSKNTIKTVLAVGAFTKEKRHELTIDAVSRTKNTKLIIAGGGGDRKKEIIDYGTSKLGKERFEVLSVSHSQMPEIYKRADLFVFPTVPWESFGIVMLEALASNLPVVATDDPIRREIVGDAGLFVDPTNADSFANTINEALKTNWGDKPRKQAEKFSWDIIAKKYEDLFKSL